MKKGFTLIELLVVITIISLMSTVGVVRYRNYQEKSAFKQQVEEFVSSIRQMQSMAQNAQEVDGEICQQYGLEVKDIDPDSQVGESYKLYCKGEGGSKEEINSKNLRENIVFETIGQASKVYFEPPVPTLYIDDIQGFKIKHKEKGFYKTIQVSSSGQIKVSSLKGN